MEEKKETLGSIVYEGLKKDEQPYNAVELSEAALENYMPNVLECVEKYRKIFPGDFYIEVLSKGERILYKKVWRFFYAAKLACPTPNYDQDLFRYRKDTETLEFLWSIPSREACVTIKENALQLPLEQQQLLKFVLDFADGTLYQRARQLNGEDPVPV